LSNLPFKVKVVGICFFPKGKSVKNLKICSAQFLTMLLIANILTDVFKEKNGDFRPFFTSSYLNHLLIYVFYEWDFFGSSKYFHSFKMRWGEIWICTRIKRNLQKKTWLPEFYFLYSLLLISCYLRRRFWLSKQINLILYEIFGAFQKRLYSMQTQTR
jgi:hypothetical protein